MTQKERFVNTLQFKPVDRVPFMEICLWAQTHERWVREGMPKEVDGAFMRGNDYFGLEGYDTLYLDAVAPNPRFEERVIEESGDQIVFQDGFGRIRRARKSGTVGGTRMSMDQYISFAVKDRPSFLEMKRRYNPHDPKRYPENWADIVARLRQTEKPLTLLDPLAGTFGYYSMLRNWMGTEGLSYLFYDDPKLIHECLEFLTDFAISLFEKAVSEIQFDFYFIHEDMSYKNGPLVSPACFREFFLPHYKRFIEFLRSHGVDLILVDTDGNFEVLIPLFLEAGVNGFGPMEAAAGMDPVKTRREYGKKVCMTGGIDKRAIAKGKKAIEAEVRRKIVPILDEGGFIPMIDHAIPPEISLADFRYYLDLKRQVIFG